MENKVYYLTNEGIQSEGELIKLYSNLISEIFIISFKTFFRLDNRTSLDKKFEKIVCRLVEGSTKYLINNSEQNHKIFMMLRICMTMVSPEFSKHLNLKFKIQF